MRRLLFVVVVSSLASLVACTVRNETDGSSPAAGSSSSSSGGAPSDPRDVPDGSTANGSSGGDEPVPPASQTEAVVDIDGTCSAFAACGGVLEGTYDYTGGCVEDVFAGARGACPALDATKAIVKVKGSVTFNGGNVLTRDVTVSIGGSITFPQSCSLGQCAMIENELKSTFDSVSCSGSTGCTCTISNTEHQKDATTYTVQGSLLTTADGDEYSICVQGLDFTYSGKSNGAEQGTFTLKER